MYDWAKDIMQNINAGTEFKAKKKKDYFFFKMRVKSSHP